MNEQDWLAWLGQMQTEMGVLSTNNMLKDIQIKRLSEECTHLSDTVEALKERILKAEKANQELKEQIQPHRKKH
jgi:hypothetical protein